MKKLAISVFILLVLSIIHTMYAFADADIAILKKQAARGSADAQLELGEAYYYGEGVLKDPFLAKYWIKKAHENGSARARDVWENLELWRIPDRPEITTNNQIHREKSWDRTRPPWREPITGMEFIWIPPGCFNMGCLPNDQECRTDEKPFHRVCLTGFWLGRYEVTQQEYQTIMYTNPARFSYKDHPVENISWDNAIKFTRELNRREKNMYEFTLPTEAQWEYACRSLGKNSVFPWAAGVSSEPANCGDCRVRLFNGTTAPVGTFKANSIGLFDMGGNVAEWCLDIYDKNSYQSHDRLDPVYQKPGSAHIVRGGSFVDNQVNLRCTRRKAMIGSMETYYTGFRLVRKENLKSQ